MEIISFIHIVKIEIMKTLQFVSIASFILAVLISVNGCKKEETAKGTDRELYEMSLETVGFVWYKNSDVLLPKSNITGHQQSLLRTRYNGVASQALEADGKVKTGIIFPEGSLIVKELYNNSTDLSLYAIMYKKYNHPDADATGWVWGYVGADGTVGGEPASKKGSGCRGCHSQSGNIDLSLMNVAFP